MKRYAVWAVALIILIVQGLVYTEREEVHAKLVEDLTRDAEVAREMALFIGDNLAQTRLDYEYCQFRQREI